jgi:hypothetical protein
MDDDEEIEYVNVNIYNRTMEKVDINYTNINFWFLGYITKTTLEIWENKLVTLEKNKKYQAKGVSTEKEHDSRSFSFNDVWYITPSAAP